MQDFEKLGAFYLGRHHNLPQGKSGDEPVLYDSKDLLTHAVCVGMTGSGKTGLGIGLLEEAAIDGIPALIIDPKGDLTNLLLNFPELEPEQFLPWVDEDGATRRGLSKEEYAREQAELWRNGLVKWGQTPERIRKLRDSAEFSIYTPGSDAGIPVSVIASFAAPPENIRNDRDLLRDSVSATTTSLLALIGVEADPLKSREHILIATIFDRAWKNGEDLDLGSLIQQIQNPPVNRIGVFDLESFYPAKDRFGLAMALNNVLAAPGFEVWLSGEPLDVNRLLYTAQGKPRMAIFSIAHLSDSERMFFVSLLLGQTVSWMRTQPGTTSLRAILYMDEIFGYFPPVANPPSKLPLLTLLKQARAFGLGVVLATQNPVDLDYKGLSNAGTWFIGRLQTERDKARVMEGLEGAAAAAGSGFNRGAMEQTLAGLSSRIFLMNNVHEDAPVIFETRWALSYLRGPLTRPEIKRLMSARGAPAAEPKEAPRFAAPPSREAGPRPALPPEIPQYFFPSHGSVVYEPMLLGIAQVRLVDAKNKVDETRDFAYLTRINDDVLAVNWDDARLEEIDAAALEQTPVEESRFVTLPPAGARAKSYAGWSKDFVSWLSSNAVLNLWRSTSLGEVSRPGETERDFRLHVQQLSREQRDRAIEELRQKYAPKLATLEDRIRRARQAVEREQQQSQGQFLAVAGSIASTLAGALFGRKTLSATNLRRAGTAARQVSRSRKESGDVQRALETVEALETQREQLDEQLQAECDRIRSEFDSSAGSIEELPVRPRKSNISVRLFGLAWVPQTAP
ncbi:MAG TPA: hypothetical protein VFQ79_01635 [Bryobacteraceae bacterium]|nr:hypothetical protein [Bryobacteraceae bacterium]